MPIAINGSGTITGLSVGGLPDGIVDNDMIANSTIASGKLAAATGKILQVVHNSGSSTKTADASTDHVEIINASITPAATSSKILVFCNAIIESSPSSNAYAGGYIKRGDISGTTIKTWALGQSAYHESFISPFVMDEPNTTSSTQYTWTISKWSSGTTHNKALSTGYSILLMEIGA
mgnify:CR=1 FL=1